MVLFPPPFYLVLDISNLLSYIQNNFSYELARPIMGTIFLVTIFLNILECRKGFQPHFQNFSWYLICLLPTNTSVVFSSSEIASLLNVSDPVSASAYSFFSSTSTASLDPVSTLVPPPPPVPSQITLPCPSVSHLMFFLHSKDLTHQKVHQGTVEYVRASLIFITQSSYQVHLGVTRVLHPLLALNSAKFHLIIHHQVSH